MNRFNIFISITFFTLFLSCAKIDPHKLPGTYVFNQPDNSDTLIVLANHFYIHSAYRNRKKQLNTGKWEFNGIEISFNNFTFFDGLNGVWMSRVIQDGKDMKLNYAEEEKVFYLKK